MKYQNKLLLSSLSIGFIIFFRKKNHYCFIPRRNIFTAFIFGIWTYLNYLEPLAIPLGILIFYINELFFWYFYNYSNIFNRNVSVNDVIRMRKMHNELEFIRDNENNTITDI